MIPIILRYSINRLHAAPIPRFLTFFSDVSYVFKARSENGEERLFRFVMSVRPSVSPCVRMEQLSSH